jgi:MFS family permease
MREDLPAQGEWQRGWTVAVGAGLTAATGANLLYFVFSIFIPSLMKDTGWTLGQFSQLQALVGLGSLVAPLVGWAFDHYGLRPVYALGMVALTLLYIFIALMPLHPILFGVMVFVTGVIGVFTTSIAYTRAVTPWFTVHRGFALAVSATGLSLAAIIFPPIFERLISAEGWRAGYWLLAALSGLIGLPVVLKLLRDPPWHTETIARPASRDDADHGFARTPTFWAIGLAYICINLPGSGLLSQAVPMLQEEGLSFTFAAWGISAFASGQLVGRLGCGWLLDRRNPSRVAALFTAIPAIGCLILWGTHGSTLVALLAIAAVGIQQGAEIDLIPFFVARRFGTQRYGTIYGWLQMLAWAGTLTGILLFGKVHDWTGSYALFQMGAAVAYLIAALTFSQIRLPPVTPVNR